MSVGNAIDWIIRKVSLIAGGLFVVGCGISAVGTLDTSAQSEPDAGEPDATATVDAAMDASFVDAPDTCATWTARHFTPCAIPGPGPAITLPAGTITYDTDLPGFVEDPPADPPALALAQGGTEAVLVSVESLTIPAGTTLRVIGARPLVIASWSTITVDGVLDVGSSTAENRVGAGANPTLCAVGAAQAGADETTSGGGSGGGGGGAFGGNGGKGGPGDGLENAGGNGGQKLASAPTIVRGGCPGARSGKAGPDSQVTAPTGDDTVTPGGAGGGAIQLSARVSIIVGATGRVRAGGAGGRGSVDGAACGGGGGGSGGYIGFDAPAYTFATGARVAANGGGGGTSAEFDSPNDAGGGNGADGRDDATQAAGGTYPNTCALDGPPGAAGATLDGPNANQGSASCGGAGGAGGVGFILVFGAFTQPADVVFSPKSTVVP